MKPDSRRALGIDIGGTSTKIAVVNSGGEVLEIRSIPTDLREGAHSFARAILANVPPASELNGAGVCIAGFVDDERTRMVYNPNLPALEQFPLKQTLEDRLKLPVTLDADSNSACYGEYWAGTGAGARRFLCLVLGTGAGGGMMIDGRLVRLAYGGLGDLGHVIVEPGGPQCSGGCRGCLEAMLQANAEPLGKYVGLALATYAAVLFPDRIAIGGGRAEAGEALLQPAELAFRQASGDFYRRDVVLNKARLGWQAPVIGAALQSLLES